MAVISTRLRLWAWPALVALGIATSVAFVAAGSANASQAHKANPSKVYASGVPTLNQLYKGTYGTPPKSSPPIAKKKFVIFVSCGQSSPGCADVPDAMRAPAKLLGWKFQIIDGMLNNDNGWDKGINQAIAERPDAIVVHGMNCSDVKQPLENAKAAHIPVMGLEDVDCSDKYNPGGPAAPLFGIPIEYGPGMPNGGAYFNEWGKVAADYLIDATQGKAKIIQTVYQSSFGSHQLAGQDAQLKKCRGCKVVARLPFPPGPSLNPGGSMYQQFGPLLLQHPEANAVLFNFDTLPITAGLSKEIVHENRQKSLFVVAGEGTAPADQLIRQAQGLTADSAHSGNWISWGAADELNRYFNHKPAVSEGDGFQIVDKTHNLPARGQNYEGTINFETQYKKIWHVK